MKHCARGRRRWIVGVSLVLAALSLAGMAGAQDQPAPKPQEPAQGPQKKDLTELSIEELSQLTVTSVSKKGESLMDAPAAITVIRGEDLKRTGVRSLAEALRMVPGMHVARINSNKWAIGCRGFSDRFANKLLVLIDGRTVYTSLFSGVMWEFQDTLLEDVERIEVIRGPGSTVWGANAVSGVINIITKKSQDTQGGYAELGGGTEERGIAGARYGGKAGNDVSYRVYAKYFNRDEGDQGQDWWYQSRGGFRVDYTPSPDDTFTVSGEIYGGSSHWNMNVAQLAPPYVAGYVNRSEEEGGHLLARWEHRVSATSDLAAQVYYDRWQYDDINWGEDFDTLDLDLRCRFTLLDWNELIVGGGYRRTWDQFDTKDNGVVAFDPKHESVGVANVFLQDEIALIKDQVYLTVGVKLEYNEYSKFEYQPGARLSWRLHEDHTLWASAARAVRTPSRAEDSIRVLQQVIPPFTPANPGPFPIAGTIWGNHDWKSEELLAFEMGYRVQPVDVVSIDTALFLNVYDRLRSNEPGTPFPDTLPIPNYLILPLVFENGFDAKSYGIEISATWRVMDGWTVSGNYSFIYLNLDQENDSTALSGEEDEDGTPANRVYPKFYSIT
jgi:iron complex outermembrane receptor protein